MIQFKRTAAATVLSLWALASGTAAQVSQQDAQDALDAWRLEHGTNWHMRFDERLGAARMLYGGKLAPAFTPEEDAQFATLARDAVAATRGFHSLSPDTLVEAQIRFLPLGMIGSTDKIVVEFHQERAGVRVGGGWVNALFDLDGNLLALDVQALAGVESLDTEPEIEAGRATALAQREFRRLTGLPATRVETPELLIHRAELEGVLHPVLAWSIDASFEQDETVPEAYRLIVDAHTGRILESVSTVHHFDVSGTVMSNVSPGTLPDIPSNPATPQPIGHLRVTNNQNGNVVYTDTSGFFNIPGATPGVQATFEYDGLYTTTTNDSGPDYSLTQTLNQSAGNSVLMNAAPTEFITAQANSANWISLLRDYVVTVDPGDTAMDQVWASKVNMPFTCAAFYNGGVNFAWETAQCVNTAYSSVVLHEMGHGLNVNYGTGNSQNGMGEGMADVFAMYVTDDPVIGRDLCGPGCNVRTGLNTRQFCGDCCLGCHGSPHADGEVLMGAYWKVRRNLKATLGNSAGSAVADGLLSGWNNGFNQTEIQSIIVTQWVLLDDDDGNINNGSPNYLDITEGFEEQGFPGLNLCVPTTYCTAKTGLLCGVPDMTWSGAPSASATSGFEVIASPARGLRSGVLIYGNSGQAGLPFQGGFLCVNPPVLRTPLASSGGTNGGCDGDFRLDMNAFASGQLGGNPAAFLLQIGQVVNTQWWGRDSVPTGSLLSNGLEYTVCP